MTSTSELDNPVWFSLRNRHREMTLVAGKSRRFPADVAPFLAVNSPEVPIDDAMESLIAPDETVYLLGVAPRTRDGWSLKAYRPLAQMICPRPIAVNEGPEWIELTDVHRADVLELTALVYPHYFRPRTMAMGRYFGIYHDNQLAAMIGERLGTDAFTEISAICTHPKFNRLGYARRLIAMLSNDNLERGRIPFLHVSRENERALRLYEQIGYHHRPDTGFWSLRRG